MNHIGVNYLHNSNGIDYFVYEKFVETNTQKTLNDSRNFCELIRYFVLNKEKLKGKEIRLSNNFLEEKRKSLDDLLTLLELN